MLTVTIKFDDGLREVNVTRHEQCFSGDPKKIGPKAEALAQQAAREFVAAVTA